MSTAVGPFLRDLGGTIDGRSYQKEVRSALRPTKLAKHSRGASRSKPPAAPRRLIERPRPLPRDASAQQGMGPRVYYGYCPLGDKCRKGNSALCRKDSRLDALDFVENHLLTSCYHKDDPKVKENLEELMQSANGDICCWSDAEDSSGKGREIIEGAVALEAKEVRDARRGGRVYTPEPSRKEQLRLKECKEDPAGRDRKERSARRSPSSRHPVRRSRSREAKVRSRSPSEASRHRRRSPSEASRHRSRLRDGKERSAQERRKKEQSKKERRTKTSPAERDEAPAFSKAPGGGVAWPPSLALAAPMLAASSSSALGASDWVRMPRQELVGILEALVRAQRSVQHSGRIAHAAGQAFDAESINLEHCKLVVERALMRAAP